jgi:hypothetical protein
MAVENEHLIWGPLRSNESFHHDLRRFFEAPAEILENIAERTKILPYKSLSESEAQELSDNFEWQTEELQRIAAILLLLRQRLLDTGLDPMEALSESRGILDIEDLAKGREDEFANILSYSEEDREESLAIQAFSSGPAFLDVRLLPSLIPVSSSDTELVGTYVWTISYLNAEGEQRSVTIGLTPGELEQLEAAIADAKEQLKAIKRSSRFARREES